MDQTDKEFRKIFEETTTRNVRAVLAFSNDTRKLVHELEETVSRLQQQLRIQDETIGLLRLQLVSMQSKVFSGGT